jgi:hypothetical protein
MKTKLLVTALAIALTGCATTSPMGQSANALGNLLTGTYIGGRNGPPLPTQDQLAFDAARQQGLQPSQEDAERVIKNQIMATMKDPDSIKQFAIVRGPVFVDKDNWGGLFFSGHTTGWAYCAQSNGKNSYGAYAGVTVKAFLLRTDGSGVKVVSAQPNCS